MPVNWFDTPLALATLNKQKPTEQVSNSGFVPLSAQRNYASALPSRLNAASFSIANVSADAELVTALRRLRARSRQLVRDSAFAKNAKRIIVNNVIGTGIRLQSKVMNARDGMHGRVNSAVEAAFEGWCRADSCHTGGVLQFHDMERLMMGQVFEAGEIFIRIYRRRFGSSEIPIALEVIEPERVMDGFEQPGPGPDAVPLGGTRMGIEVDDFNRPIAYWIRKFHPGDIRFQPERVDSFERVPAADMFHLKLTERWPQTRGEPWLHAVARKLADMDGYSEAEIIAARGAASYLGTIESPEKPETFGEVQPDGSIQTPVEPGMWMRLLPGEKADFVAPNRPNAALDPFMRFMLREVASGIGASYESLSRDYSQSNYSSSRLALLDDRDCWRALQQWFIRSFRERFHQEWLQAAVLSKAIPEIELTQYANAPEKFESVIFRPRGWSWVDPTREVAAFKEAVKAGFTTVGDVISQTSGGLDLEDVLETRADELAYMTELNLPFDTSPVVYVPAESRGQIIQTPDGPKPVAEVTAEAQAANAPPPAPAPAAAGAQPAAPEAKKGSDAPADGKKSLRVVRQPNRY